MGYILGYMAADGCVMVDKKRKNNPYSLNITSVDHEHLCSIKKAFGSEHKISLKNNGRGGMAYQLQIRNRILGEDLIRLGIVPRKTFVLKPIKVSKKYFPDLVRGFFDGDGSVYLYKVNNTPQIKVGFVCASLQFIENLNARLCAELNIPEKTVHCEKRGDRMPRHTINFYINDCEKLSQFMYKNKPELFLERKKNIFDSWKTVSRRHFVKANYPSKIGWGKGRMNITHQRIV